MPLCTLRNFYYYYMYLFVSVFYLLIMHFVLAVSIFHLFICTCVASRVRRGGLGAHGWGGVFRWDLDRWTPGKSSLATVLDQFRAALGPFLPLWNVSSVPPYVRTAWCVWYLVLLLCFDISVSALLVGNNVLITSVEPRHNVVFSWKTQPVGTFLFLFSCWFFIGRYIHKCPYWLY